MDAVNVKCRLTNSYKTIQKLTYYELNNNFFTCYSITLIVGKI